MRSTVRQIALCQKNVQKEHLARLILLSMLITLLIASSGCSSMNYRRIAYETLRQVDCKVNELDDFCERTFANDFHEYERLREDHLNNNSVKESWLGRDSYEPS